MSCNFPYYQKINNGDSPSFIKNLGSIEEFEIKSCLGLKILEFSIQGHLPAVERKILVRFTKVTRQEEFFLLLAVGSLNSMLIRSIRLCTRCISSGTLRMVLKKSEGLEEFKIKKCDEKDLNSILMTLGSHCPRLRFFSLPEAISVEAMDLSLLKECRQIETMMITQYQGHLERGLKNYLIRAGQSLCTLNLNGCVDVTESLLKRIGVACPNLTLLNLGNCMHLSFSHLRHLNKTRITHLCLEGFYGRVDEIRESLDLFSGLIELSLCQCEGAAEIVETFQGEWKFLQELDISQCEGMTIKVLESLLSTLKTLRVINVQGNVYEEEELRKLKQEFPQTTILHEILFGDS